MVQYVSQIIKVDGANFVPGILDRDDSQFCYQTNLKKNLIKNDQANIDGSYGNEFWN